MSSYFLILGACALMLAQSAPAADSTTTSPLTSASVSAAASMNLDLYHHLVEQQRDGSGKLIQLLIKPQGQKNSQISTAELDVVSVFQESLQNLRSVEPLTESEKQDLLQSGWNVDDVQNFNDAKALLASNQEVPRLLGNKIVSEILREFQKDINLIFQFNVLAKPHAPGYFHERALIDKALKKALASAEKAFGFSPASRAVEFLLNTSLGWVEMKRSYCQNVLLFYLQKSPAAELGLSEAEVALIQSSIFERDIAWWDVQSLNMAKKNWTTFGAERFARKIASNEARLARYGAGHGDVFTSLNFAFATAKKSGIDFILNSQDPQSKFSHDLSMAFDRSRPRHLRDFRWELQLTQLASSLLPIPSLLRNQLNSLINSYYSGQATTEGALFASLSTAGQSFEATTVLDQSINPILIHDLRN